MDAEVGEVIYSGHHQDVLYFERLSGWVEPGGPKMLVNEAATKEIKMLTGACHSKFILHKLRTTIRYSRLNPTPERRAAKAARLLKAEGIKIAPTSVKTVVKPIANMIIK